MMKEGEENKKYRGIGYNRKQVVEVGTAVTDGKKPSAAGANKPVYVAVNEQGKRIGETHHRAKLTDAQVDAMRDEYEAGVEGNGPRVGYRVLARKYGVGKSTVRSILSYRCRAQYAARHKRITKV